MFQVVPEGFRELLVWVKNQYGNPPLIITENGFIDGGQLDDFDRITYIQVFILLRIPIVLLLLLYNC